MATEPLLPPVPPVILTGSIMPPDRVVAPLLPVGPAEDLPPLRARTGRSTLPWEEILAAYLTPTVSEDGLIARWPSLRDLAARFNCAEQTLKEASAEEGWVKRQQLSRRIWTSERTEALNEQMAQGAAVLRMASYQNGVKLVNRATTLLNDPTILTKAALGAAAINREGLETCMKAAGMPTVAQGANLGVFVNVQAPAEGAAPVGGSPAGNLWSVLVEARRSPAPAVDPFDAPSPLPASLASR